MTRLILDCNYLAHRAFHSLHDLSHRDVPTAVVFGVLRDVQYLQDLYLTDKLIFCFDVGKSIRRLTYPNYKVARYEKQRTEEEEKAYQELLLQIRMLRKEYLPEIGFRNIFWQRGYEADDLIAAVCKSLNPKKTAIIISADQDLFQLLDHNIKIYNPHKKRLITQKTFTEEYGVGPTQWVDVKSIAGCNTDGITGIKGVGEKTAIKFLQGKLKPESKAFQSIVKGDKVWKRNRGYVKIPFPGTNEFTWEDDEVTRKKWNRFAKKLGMSTLIQ